MKKITALLLITFLFCYASFAQNNTTEKDTTENTIQRVSKAEFVAYMAENSEFILLDVRTPLEFNRGTIDGAINIDFTDSNFKSEINKLDKSQPILLFCQSGGRSSRALVMLKSVGFKCVLELEGGYGQY
ncbi:MAG: rhodanese-like domain-containing protein [Crocinitomicaceae bacterium]